MKHYLCKHVNFVICLIILTGFLVIACTDYYIYGKVIKDDIENISKLTSSNIYAEINNELTKPMFVSLTMANDAFLKSWLHEEQSQYADPAHRKKLLRYLQDLRKKYAYNSVFLVSASSNLYYHYEGVHKKVSPRNAHDVWYYAFLKSGKTCDLDVDVDEADNNVLTVFINCRVEDADGTLLGVVGVGLRMRYLQDLLNYFEKNFHLSTFLVNREGLVQVHTDADRIEKVRLSDLLPVRKEAALPPPEAEIRTAWYDSGNRENYLIVRYIDQMEWYLVVDKDTAVLRSSFFSLLARDFCIIAVVIAVLLLLSSHVVRTYRNRMILLATTDELSGLLNRRAFRERLEKHLTQRRRNGDVSAVFIFDIDRFKKINDTRGHLHGDRLIKDIGRMAETVVGDAGIVARWGGDEFVGLLDVDGEAAASLLLSLRDMARGAEEFQITLSIGATRLLPGDTPDTLMHRADAALYAAKEGGRDCVVWH